MLKLSNKGEGCKYSLVVPLIDAALKISCNIQLCSRRFVVSCLQKCVAGKEIRKSLHFICGSNSG